MNTHTHMQTSLLYACLPLSRLIWPNSSGCGWGKGRFQSIDLSEQISHWSNTTPLQGELTSPENRGMAAWGEQVPAGLSRGRNRRLGCDCVYVFLWRPERSHNMRRCIRGGERVNVYSYWSLFCLFVCFLRVLTFDQTLSPLLWRTSRGWWQQFQPLQHLPPLLFFSFPSQMLSSFDFSHSFLSHEKCWTTPY